MLAWGVLLWPEGYKQAGQLKEAFKAIKWGTDYLIKCFDREADLYYVQIGDPEIEKKYWGRPEDIKHSRPFYFITRTRTGK